jgi:hypothetical protein
MTRLWIYLAGLAGVAVVLVGLWGHGYSKGRAHVQAQWDAAEAAQLQKGVDARSAAEDEVPPDDPDAAPPAEPCRVPDRQDRDCAADRL